MTITDENREWLIKELLARLSESTGEYFKLHPGQGPRETTLAAGLSLCFELSRVNANRLLFLEHIVRLVADPDYEPPTDDDGKPSLRLLRGGVG